MKAEVGVSKARHGGRPLVQVAIDGKATPAEIGRTMEALYSSPFVIAQAASANA